MKNIRKFIGFILVVALIIGLLPVLLGCQNQKSDDEDSYMIYYSDKEADDIIFREQIIKGASDMEQAELAQALLDIMFVDDPEETKYFPAKPKEVVINKMIVKDGVITLDFNTSYLKMTNVREIILRASVVLTLIQIKGIDGVAFTVEDEAIKDSKGATIGTMTKTQFVNVLLNEEGMLKQETNLTLYFANETNDKLIPVIYKFTIDNSNYSLEEYIVDKLIKGPEKGIANPTIASSVNVLSVSTSDYICYINFDDSFLTQNQVVNDELMIYSIANSLCNLPYVNGVQFLVNGEPDNMLHKTFDLSKPIRRNGDLIAN